MDTVHLERRIKELEKKLQRIESLSQLQPTATLQDVIQIVNKITDSVKR